MKAISEIEASDVCIGLMLNKSKNRKPLPKPELAKGAGLLVPEAEIKTVEPKLLSVVNMSVYNLKNTYKDKRKIKDAVTVKRMKLLSKENIDLRKVPALMGLMKRNSLNVPGEAPKRKSEKCSLEILAKRSFNKTDSVDGMRTFTSPISPDQAHQRKGARADRAEKENQLCQNIFQTKSLLGSNKSDALINIKLRSYISSIKEGRKLHHLCEESTRETRKRILRVRIKKGNNSNLIKWLFKKRWWWTIEEDKEDKDKLRPNFVWSQLKEKSFFQSIVEEESTQVNCHNHFPQNEYLGNKKALFYNMSHYYRQKNIDVFEKLPLTFHVVSLEDGSWKKFTEKYEEFKKEGQSNIWILKPGENSNRGRGITVHESHEEIKSIVGAGETFLDSHDGQTKKRTYIIQAYIDKPFLYNRRKFDIRCYMLLVNINKTVKGYWYSEGYIRTSSFEFQLHDFNTFVHLTNDAVQNHSESYGKYEDGNKVSYAQFQKYLDSKYAGMGYDFEKQIVPKMRDIAADSIKAAVHLVKGDKVSRPVFEVFGLDFMIDRNFQPWLIEINTNPCIETSCLVLEKVIPRMLDDAFKLSLDLLFPPPEYWPSSRKHCLPSQENRFELVFDEEKDSGVGQQEYPSLGVITEDGQFYQEKQNECP